MADLPSPNVREGWRINSLMLRFRTRVSDFGGIDKIGIRDGDTVIHEFAPLVLRSYNSFSTVNNVLPGSRSWVYNQNDLPLKRRHIVQEI